jgi:hypothetical protein
LLIDTPLHHPRADRAQAIAREIGRKNWVAGMPAAATWGSRDAPSRDGAGRPRNAAGSEQNSGGAAAVGDQRQTTAGRQIEVTIVAERFDQHRREGAGGKPFLGGTQYIRCVASRYSNEA